MMNKLRLQGAFSKIHASDDLIKEVLSVEVKNKRSWNVRRTLWRVAAVAVVVAILVTAYAFWPESTGSDEPGIIAMPGIIQALACEVENVENGIVGINPGLDIGANATQNTVLYPYMISADGLGVTLKVEEDTLQDYQISFEVTCNYGILFAWEKVMLSGIAPHGYALVRCDQKMTIQNGERFFWRGFVQDDSTPDPSTHLQTILEQGDGIFVQVLIRADENIVGFAVFEMICLDERMQYFGITMRESVYYPQVNGQFQRITEEYVQEQIDGYELKPLAGNATAHGGVYHSARGTYESVDIAFASLCHGIRYTCHVYDQRYRDREITYDISMNCGQIRADNQYYTDSCTLKNDTVFFWHGSVGVTEAMENDGAVYVDVIIRADGEVIGYAVIEIGYFYSVDSETDNHNERPLGYCADSCYSVVYPPVDGQLPDLTEAQAREMIEAYKQARKENNIQ